MVAAVKNCQQMFAAAAQDGRLSKAKQRQCARIVDAMTDHPRFAKTAENVILGAYERKNGKIVGAIPWKAILDWFVANAPALLQLLVTLLALFGL